MARRINYRNYQQSTTNNCKFLLYTNAAVSCACASIVSGPWKKMCVVPSIAKYRNPSTMTTSAACTIVNRDDSTADETQIAKIGHPLQGGSRRNPVNRGHRRNIMGKRLYRWAARYLTALATSFSSSKLIVIGNIVSILAFSNFPSHNQPRNSRFQ